MFVDTRLACGSSARARAARARIVRVALRVCGGLVVLRVAAVAVQLVALWANGTLADVVDYASFTHAASRWASGGSFYEPWQLAGHYAIDYHGAFAVLYPPVALWLALPFTVLPAALWWLIPAAVLAWSAWRLHPEPWSWPLILALVSMTGALDPWYGNPGMWIVAAEAAALVLGWPAALVLMKPTLLPFAFVGIGRRSWWLATAIFAAACLPFGGLWIDWLRAAVLNPTNGGLLYSLPQVPAMTLPLALWMGSARGREIVRAWLPGGGATLGSRLPASRAWMRRLNTDAGLDAPQA